jgi:hypothetical protein
MIIEFVELVGTLCFDDTSNFEYIDRSMQTFVVDTDKIDNLLKSENVGFCSGYMYIEKLVKQARTVSKVEPTSNKYSFSDTPEWFDCILADPGQKVDLICEYNVG